MEEFSKILKDIQKNQRKITKSFNDLQETFTKLETVHESLFNSEKTNQNEPHEKQAKIVDDTKDDLTILKLRFMEEVEKIDEYLTRAIGQYNMTDTSAENLKKH